MHNMLYKFLLGNTVIQRFVYMHSDHELIVEIIVQGF